MRTVTIGTALLVAMSVIGCRTDRARRSEPTTTTGAELPSVQHDETPPPAMTPPTAVPAPRPRAGQPAPPFVDLDEISDSGGRHGVPMTMPMTGPSLRDDDSRDMSGAGSIDERFRDGG